MYVHPSYKGRLFLQLFARFQHKLENFKGNNLGGYFAIDVKTRRDPWRLILEPLNEDKQPYDNCNIDEIARYVRIVEIKEVSRHYE